MSDAQIEALAVATRREIFTMLLERPRSVQELADELPVSRPAVSQHLRKLVEAGLAKATTSGTRNVYAPDPEGLTDLRDWADQLWSSAMDSFVEFVGSDEKGRDMPKAIEPVVKTRRLGVSPQAAFDLFARRIDDWWPTITHSVSNEETAEVRLDPEVGGRLLEIGSDGEEHEWGRITEWEDGRRLAFTWYPGQSPDVATEIEVRFRAAPDGTEMILIHSGWEIRGDDAEVSRNLYESGWDIVLTPYLELVPESA